MKIKSILSVAMAALAFASCNNEDGGQGIAPQMGNFEVVLPGAPGTLAVEDPAGTAVTPIYDDVATYLVDAGGNYVLHTWTAGDITAGSKRFEQIVSPAKVVVIANKGNVTLPATTTATGLQIAMNALAIANQNAGVDKVTLMGECVATAFTSETPTDGHTLFKAAVELKSLVSRFEVGTVKPGTGLISLTVQDVYVNYYYNTYEMLGTDKQAFTETTWPTVTIPTWATDAGNVAVTSQTGTKCYAYQVFCGDMVPHIIYKVSGETDASHKLSDGTTGTFSDKFITVKGFKVGTDKLVAATAGTGEYQMKANEIYKMGLENGGIEITPEQITDKPEKEKIDLIVEISAAAWTVQTVTPEI